jgi:hypothetical protein
MAIGPPNICTRGRQRHKRTQPPRAMPAQGRRLAAGAALEPIRQSNKRGVPRSLFEGMAVEKWPTAQKKHLRTTTARNELRGCMEATPCAVSNDAGGRTLAFGPKHGPRPDAWPSARTIRYNVRWPSAQSMALGPTRGPRPVRYATTRTLCGKMQLDRVASCTSRSAPDLGMPQRRAH